MPLPITLQMSNLLQRLPGLTIFLVILFNSSCDRPFSNKQNTVNQQNKTNKGGDIKNCMNNILYYDLNIDLNQYDSIGTYYFHEIMDYQEDEAIQLFDQIQAVKEKLKKAESDDQRLALEQRKDSLRMELSRYKSEVTGHVFVHTFLNKGDTLSMIFIMDNDCNYSEAVPVNTIYDPDPDDFTRKVRKIETSRPL